MQKVFLGKAKPARLEGGKMFDEKGREIPEEHVISSRGKTLKGVSIQNPGDKGISGKVQIFDGEELVVEIDKAELSSNIVSMTQGNTGVKKIYASDEAMVTIGYTQKRELKAKGDYGDLIFFFT